MPEPKGFKLKEEFYDFSGGTVVYGPDNRTFDVMSVLPGVIVTDDPGLITALEGYEALEPAEIPLNAQPIDPTEFESHLRTPSKPSPPPADAPASGEPILPLHGDPDEVDEEVESKDHPKA